MARLVAAWPGQVVEVRPDAVGQRAEDLVHAERVGARVGLELLVLEPGQRRGAEAVAQDDLLDAEDPLEHRDVDAGPVEGRRPPVHPALGAEPAEQGGRELERLVAEDLVDQELQALALLGAGDGHDRVAGVLVGLVVARDRLAADVLRGEVAPSPHCSSRIANARRVRAHDSPSLTTCGVEVLEQLGGQRDPVLAELAGVGAEVAAVDVAGRR